MVNWFDEVYKKNKDWIKNIFSTLILMTPFSNDLIITTIKNDVSDMNKIFKGSFDFDPREFNDLRTSFDVSYGEINNYEEFNIINMIDREKELAKNMIVRLEHLRK